MLATRFTELVGCEVPIQLAPMGAISSPELMAAVVDAGGMAMTGMPMAPAPVVADFLDALTKQLRGPFGFNVLVPFLDTAVVDTAAQRCRLVDFYHGAVDGDLVEVVHRAGALAAWQVGSAAAAREAADAGCDLIVVRGVEGGGRMYGHRSLWPLLAEVLDAVDVPVLAAGGIATGRLLAAALAAGADGVRVGTRFVATVESGAHPRYKSAVADASGGETVLTDAFRVMWPDEVRTARVLQSALETANSAADPVGKTTMGPVEIDVPRFGVAPPSTTTTGNIEAMALYAGESAGAISTVEHAAEVLRRMVVDAEALLARHRDR
jgi:nitronate monooxygenase